MVDVEEFMQQFHNALQNAPNFEVVLTFDEVMVLRFALRVESNRRIKEALALGEGTDKTVENIDHVMQSYIDFDEPLLRAGTAINEAEGTKAVVTLSPDILMVLLDAAQKKLDVNLAERILGRGRALSEPEQRAIEATLEPHRLSAVQKLADCLIAAFGSDVTSVEPKKSTPTNLN